MNASPLQRCVVPLAILAGCAALWLPLRELPEPRFEPMGPALFPRIILICLAGLTLFDLALALRPQAREPDRGTPFFRQGLLCVCVMIAGFAAYLALLSETDLPYVVLTFLFVALESWYLGHFGKRALLWAVTGSTLVTALIYLLFGLVLRAFFP